MYLVVLSLCILLCGSLSGLILPIKKPDGSTDVSSLLSHITLLEQTLTSLQTTTGQLQTDLQVSKTQSAVQIASLTKEVDALKAELKQSSNDIAVLKSEMNDMKRVNSNNINPTTNTSLETLRADLAVVKKQSEDTKKLVATLASKTREVAFQVSGPTNRPPALSAVTFSKTLYNAGSAFNTTTGKFSAPESGTYMFWTNLEMVETNTNMNVYIMKTGRVTMVGGYVATDAKIYVADGSAVAVDHLSKGEEVWVEVSSTHNLYDGNKSSYFGGVMLSVD